MKNLRLRSEARQELAATFAYYRDVSASRARDFLEHYKRAAAHIASFPKMGRPMRSNLRRFSVSLRYKYFIIYREYEDYILIVAFAHQKRRPGYWKNRLKDITA